METLFRQAQSAQNVHHLFLKSIRLDLFDRAMIGIQSKRQTEMPLAWRRNQNFQFSSVGQLFFGINFHKAQACLHPTLSICKKYLHESHEWKLALKSKSGRINWDNHEFPLKLRKPEKVALFAACFVFRVVVKWSHAK